MVSTEVGWRAWFLDQRLQVAVDLFYNLYRDTIIYKTGLAVRAPLGSPFHEFVGYPYHSVAAVLDRRMDTDFGGMLLVRMAELYLRGSI